MDLPSTEQQELSTAHAKTAEQPPDTSAIFLDGLWQAALDDRLQPYIDSRVKHLSGNSPSFTVMPTHDRLTLSFLKPDTIIKYRNRSKGFRLDDPSAYQYFGEILAERIEANPSEAPQDTVLSAAQLAVANYFGFSLSISKRHREIRKNWTGGFVRGKTQSIESAKAGNFALCVERAALSHNLCLIAGVRSMFIFGKVREQNSRANAGHAFQVVEQTDGLYIFDPTQPNVKLTDNATMIKPLIARINDYGFFGGRPMGVERTDTGTDQPTETRVNDYLFSPVTPVTFEKYHKLNLGERIVVSELEIIKRHIMPRLEPTSSILRLLVASQKDNPPARISRI